MASAAAKRYAQAVFSLAKERGTLEAWEKDLASLAAVVGDPRAAIFFASPSVPQERKRTLLDRVIAGGQPEARRLALLLVERNRLGDIPEIHRLFGEYLLEERGIVVAEVTTADPLGPEEQAAVRERLSRMVGKEVELRLQTDPAIIGGIVARVGDELIDGSVVSQLRKLRQRLVATR